MSTAAGGAEAAATMFDEGTGDEGAPAGTAPPATDPPETSGDPPGGAPPATEAKPEGGKEKEYEHDWLKDVAGGKYTTQAALEEGYANSSREAKTAVEKALGLEKRLEPLQAMLGAPKNEDGTPAEYELKLPEGMEFDEELLPAYQAFCRENDFSPEFAQKALEEVLIPSEIARETRERLYQRGRALEFLGKGDADVAKKAAEDAFNWAGSQFADDPEAVADLQEMCATGAGLNTLARLRSIATGVHTGGSMGTDTTTAAMSTEEGRQKAMADPRYLKDQEYTDKVHQAINEQFPGGGPKQDEG